MRVCIYGAGASGGHFAVRLALAGHQVSVIARGSHLAAIRENGLQLKTGEGTLSGNVAASDTPADFGEQDVVIVAAKATALPGIAPHIGPLVGRDTQVVFPQNGMTWWYPIGLPDTHPKPPAIPVFELARPFLAAMRGDQVIGGIIYSANEVESPGVIKNNSPTHNRLEIAAIAASSPAQVAALSNLREALEDSGILSPDPGDIRAAVWTKLVNNMSGSALGLATRSPSDGARKDKAMSEIYRRIMREGLSIAAAHGYPLDIDPDRMLKRLLDHKASILQDYEQGRPMEIAEIVLAPLAFARSAGIATPTLDTVAAIVTKLAKDKGLVAADLEVAL
ncbi:2-dehydropantoate 2-reductase [Pseudorhodoplanes sp.]|uniref:ketopantoate reductase family protein n=1 Tax=Pseudorhodoplanes sp. TaxID=1934341 RepID=UPI002CAC185B|nr:2-dehydropantoate 2-reductase [Pseudorhodoplanes sp.]HWV43574.1 2-dehydropantoate 2-reductase [Pseudorhodoplanes sp.]